MSVIDAFSRGTARIWLHKRLLLWLYALNLLFAAVLVFPFRQVVGELSKTDLADDFVSGFRVDSFLDFWLQHFEPLKALGYAAVGLGVLYLIVSIFLSGGIVAALTLERRVSLRRFLNDSARYFWRYLRLFVLLVVVVGLIVAGYTALVGDFVEDLQESATTDVASFLWRALSVIVVLVLVSLVIMVFDYAKIRTVVDRRRSMFVATVMALAFSVRRFWQTIPLFFLNLLIVCAVFAVYLVVENQFSNATTVSMISLFVIQQVLILSRIWMRLSFFSTQLAYYRSVTEPLPLRAPLDVPPSPREPSIRRDDRASSVPTTKVLEDSPPTPELGVGQP